MSVEYNLVCHKHKEQVWVCSDGISGPMLQCGWEAAGFMITHRDCDLNVIDENDDSCEDYKQWEKGSWKELLNYSR